MDEPINEPDKKYIEELKNAIFDWAYTAPDNAKNYIEQVVEEGGEEYLVAWAFDDYTFTFCFGADETTGERDGAYYTETAKAQQAVVERGVLIDPQFLDWIGEHDGRHLEELFRDGGFDEVDVWYRKYVLERHLTATEILTQIQNGIKAADPQYKKLEIK